MFFGRCNLFLGRRNLFFRRRNSFLMALRANQQAMMTKTELRDIVRF